MDDGAAPSADVRTAESARRTALILALLALVAAALRLWRLGDWSFWADEISTLRDAKDLHRVALYPIGYAIIGFAVRLFGSSEFAARIVPALVGVVSVPALYLIGRKIFSERAAIISAALLAFASYHIFFSQEARYYTLVMLLVMLGMWSAFAGIERNCRARLIGAVILLGLAALTHPTAALALPALALYAFCAWRTENRTAGLRWSNMAILFGPFIVGAIVVGSRFISFAASWRAKGGFSLERSALAAVKLADAYEPAAIVCVALALWMLLRMRDRRGMWLACWALVPPALVVLFVGFTEGGRRFGLIALPAWLLLAGEALDFLVLNVAPGAKKIVWLLAAIVLISLGVKDVLYFTVERGQRPRWREAVAFAEAEAQKEGAWVMTAAPAGPEELNYYMELLGYQNVEPESVDLPELERLTADRTCYVLVEHTANVRPSPELMAFLEKNGSLVQPFPLKVRGLLDYSLSVYRVPAARRSPG